VLFFTLRVFRCFTRACRLQESLHLTDRTGTTYKYETFVPGRQNSHDPWTCTTCTQRRESGDSSLDDDVAMSSIRGDYEADFAAAGLGREPDNDFCGTENVFDRTCYGVQDVIITGTVRLYPCLFQNCFHLFYPPHLLQTESRHSTAWGHYLFLGRIRRWDGLIAFVRVAAASHRNSAELGRWVFTGYLDGGEIITGSWRICGTEAGLPGLEGPFHMSKISA
jgi:hypothetical protein